MEGTFSNFKQSVGMRINTLMSLSDGLGPSIFCRKIGNARPMRVEMDGKMIISRQSRHFIFDAITL